MIKMDHLKMAYNQKTLSMIVSKVYM